MQKKTATAKSKAQKKTTVKTTRRVNTTPARKTTVTTKTVVKKTAPKTAVKRVAAPVKKAAAKPAKLMDNSSHGFMLFLIVVLLLAIALFLIVKPYWSARQAPPVMTENPPAKPTLVGNTWDWQGTILADESVIEPVKAGEFTLNFTTEANNALVVTTDCNGGRSSFEVSDTDNSLTIKPIASTMKFCLDSQESVFTRALSQVESYKILENDQLQLNLVDGSVMNFDLVTPPVTTDVTE